MSRIEYFKNILENFNFLIYFFFKRNKKKKFIGFADDYFEGNTKNIILALKKKNECFWISRYKDTIKEAKRKRINSFNYFTLVLKLIKVDCWVTSNSDRIPSLIKTKYISTDHGIPIKAFVGKKKNQHIHTLNKYLHLLPGLQTYEFYKNYYKIDKSKLFITGYARNDELLKTTKLGKKIFLTKFKLNPNYKTLMYAPTWSHDFKNQNKKGLFPDEWKDDFVILKKFLNSLSKKNINIIIRLHKYHDLIWTEKHEAIIKSFPYTTKVSSSSHPNSSLFLKYTDILITDYSSIYNDFLIINRPIIFLNSKKNIFKKFIPKVFPGPSANNISQLINLINLFINNKNYYKNRREKIKSYTHVNSKNKFTKNCVNIIEKLIK